MKNSIKISDLGKAISNNDASFYKKNFSKEKMKNSDYNDKKFILKPNPNQKMKNVRISKYQTIANVIGTSTQNVANYINGIQKDSKNSTALIIQAASKCYDIQLAKFKDEVKELIKKEIEKIE